VIDLSNMLVIHNANLHTLDPQQPAATALAIDHGCVVSVGMDDKILSTFSPPTLFNALGHPIIPGLTDAHIHLEDCALSLQKVDCETATQQECLQRVAKRVNTTPPGEWIYGHGWNQNNWAGSYPYTCPPEELLAIEPLATMVGGEWVYSAGK